MANDNTTVRPVAQRKRRRADFEPALEVLQGCDASRVFALDRPHLIIGKGDEADIKLGDSGVSRKHAKVVVSNDGGVSIMDLASTNGTYVNDAAVDLAPLREGDRIRVGPDAVLCLTYRAPEVPAQPEAETLSVRQLDVARLVADGLTNAEIAARLGISPRTVTSHLDHIYARLGIGSRAALTRHIVESGLLD